MRLIALIFLIFIPFSGQTKPLDDNMRDVLHQLFEQSFIDDTNQMDGCRVTAGLDQVCKQSILFKEIDTAYAVMIFDRLLKERVHFDGPDDEIVDKGSQISIHGDPARDFKVAVIFTGHIHKKNRTLIKVMGNFTPDGQITISTHSKDQK